MRRVVLPVLMISLLLLTACGAGGAAAEETLEARRDALAAAEELRFTADVTAFIGDEAFDCTLECTATPEEVAVEVLAPELVAGVKAVVTDGETALRYEGVQLELGSGPAGPLGAMPLVVRGLRAGHVIRAWSEKSDADDLLVAELYADDTLELKVWFDARSLAPVHASVSGEGVELVKCDIREFTVR